ncbi:MAG: hypothetical protein ACKVT2_04580 [Saprospiraceae bacterium]
MKKSFFFTLISLFFATLLIAQNTGASTTSPSINDQEVRKTTESLTAKYMLNADQAKQMYTIQLRKAKNMAQIETFQTTEPALFRAKMQNIQRSTVTNIRRILNTKEQVEIYQKTQAEIRVLRNKKQKELAAQKASKETVEIALLAIYAE